MCWFEPACRQAGPVLGTYICRGNLKKVAFFMIYVYAITSTTRNYIYVGMTNDVERRIKEHNNGENKSTKAYAPFTLIYIEEFTTRIEARKREKYFKSGIG